MVESNELIKKDFNIDKDNISLEEQKKKIFNNLITERFSDFWNLEKRTNSDNMIYKYKSEGRSPKDFRNYQLWNYLKN